MEKEKYSILVCDCGEQYSIKRPEKDQEGVLLFTLNSGVTKTLKVPGFAWARTAGQPRYIDYEVR